MLKTMLKFINTSTTHVSNTVLPLIFKIKPLIVIQPTGTRVHACIQWTCTFTCLHMETSAVKSMRISYLVANSYHSWIPNHRLQECPGFARWPDQHEPAHQCTCSYTLHLIPSPGNCAWSHPRYSSEKLPVRLCFPKLVFSARAPYFISVSHWLLCVIFDTLLWVLLFYVIPWSVKNSLFSRRSCSYPAVFLFSLKLRESLQVQGKTKNKSRNNISAEMYLGGPIPPMQWPQQCNFRSCGSFY